MMRDRSLDIVKALAIIMMVAFHARAPKIIASFGCLFHMGVFFVIAGWLFEFRYTESISQCAGYVKKKIVRLWFPFVFWSLLCVLFHNLLLDWNVISDCEMDKIIEADFVSQHWSLAYLKKQLMLAPFMIVDGWQLCGAFWFLRALFFAATGYCGLSCVFRLLQVRVLPAQTIVSVAALIFARYIKIPFGGYIICQQIMTAYALLHLGVLVRRFDLRVQRIEKWAIAMIAMFCFLSLAELRLHGGVSIGANQYPSCMFFLLCTACGYFLMVSIVAFIPYKVGLALSWIGRRTMPILILHFAVFKLVNAVLVWMHGAPARRIAEFPVSYSNGCYWIVYLVVGIAVPLLLYEVYVRIIRRFANLIRLRS